ncbi:MAG TPA: hypothetical protein VMS96_14940, partial [Terriglobales bacterium]|nr:hypothetical protein [Terriglobales bacterium]
LGTFRVQVKSAWMTVPRGPHIVNLKRRWQNRRSAYDVVAIYLARLDFWYVIPASAIRHQYLRLYPHTTNPRAKYEIYREGWRTLTGDPQDDTRLIGLSIKANVGAGPQGQIAVAREIRSDPRAWWPRLSWTTLPTNTQVEAVSTLIWQHFGGARLGSGSARSAAQLAVMVNKLRSAPRTRELILEANQWFNDPDEAVQQVLDFLRLWANFHFPRLLRSVDRIQREIFASVGMRPGNYDFFASRVENLFIDSNITALDDYGVPLEVGRKLTNVLDTSGDLDAVLERLRQLNVDMTNLSAFEKQLVREAQVHL